MAKLLGAGKVIATASSDQKLDLARYLDAHVLVDYTEKAGPRRCARSLGARART
jgi:NADPH2:quinone reductase